MTRLVTAELLVLRKRAATWILLGLWTFLAVFFAYVIPYALDPEGSPTGLDQLLPGSLAGNLIVGFPFFGGVLALMLGVFALGSEYGWGTPKTLFTQGPGRLRVLAAKLLGLGIVLVPFVLAVFAAGRGRELRHRPDRERSRGLAVCLAARARARQQVG